MWNIFEVLSEEEVFNDTFSINTVFRIKNSSSLVNHFDPKLCATFFNKRIAIAIDNTLVIFEDEAFSDGKTLNFDTKVNCLTISKDGTFVLCGLSDGSICGVHFKGIPIFNVEINETDVSSNCDTFVSAVEYNAEYYFCCSNGKVYKVHNIANDEISKSLAAVDDDAATLNETLANNVLLDLVLAKRTNANISSYSITLYENELLHVLGGDDYAFLRNGKVDHNIPLQKNFIKQMQCNAMLIFFLSKNGNLYELCAYTNTFMPLLVDCNIKEFIMTETNDNGIELLALVEESPAHFCLKNFEYPSMKCKFSLPVSDRIWLIKRLQTLLAKKLLVEAEEFAKKFQLDLQPVYEAKAKVILQDIGQVDRNDKEAVEKRFDDLIAIAKIITDTEFLLKLRDLEMTERLIMKKLLQFLIKHVDLSVNWIISIPVKAFNIIQLQGDRTKVREEIEEQLLRLNTLQMIDPNECDMHWQKFVQHQNIGNYCFKYLDNNISMACLILKQHASSIIPHLKEKVNLKVLDTIPQQVEPFGIICWAA